MSLVNYIREHSAPLDPIETGETAVLPVFSGIRAVVFDIYGTVLISSAGDISLAGGESEPGEAMRTALAAADLKDDPQLALERYHELIGQQQDQLRKSGIEFPEVEIRKVWTALIEGLGGDSGKADEACIAYECIANPVWPMPGFQNCIKRLRARGLQLGIVSNAQFYTRLLFPSLTGGTLEELGFAAELMVFSYEEREGKPSRNLYARLARKLAEREIEPWQVLYVGNDLLKDVWPAQCEGFKTVLFAGDKRSLRWHSQDGRLAGIKPDALVTDLHQITTLLA